MEKMTMNCTPARMFVTIVGSRRFFVLFFLICFFASFGSFFLHSFSLVRWCYSGPTQALWSTFIFTVFLPRHSFSAIMEGKFFSPEGVVTS